MSITQLWIVNQYAVPTDEPGITRHAALASIMRSKQIETTIFAADTHYLTRTRSASRTSGFASVETKDNSRFFRLRTPGYVGNGMRRIVNMIAFSLSVLFFGTLRRPEAVPRPNVILGSSPHLFGAFSAMLLARRYRVPFVLEVRDIHPKSIVALMGTSGSHPYVLLLAALERTLYRRAALLISPLQGFSDHARHVASDCANTLWVPNGVDLREELNPPRLVDRDQFTVMYAGAHGVANSLATAVEAAEILQDRNRSLRLVLVGSGVEKKSLVRLAAQKNLRNVEFRDAVPKNTIRDVLREADCFLFILQDSPLWADGLSPNKLYDYMSGGRPTVMAVSTPYNPVAESGAGVSAEAGNAVSLAHAIEQLAALPLDQRQRMADRGIAFVKEHHDLSKIAQNLADSLLIAASRAMKETEL